MDRRDHQVERREQVLGEIERSVEEDVDLHPGVDPEGRQLLVELGDEAELLAEPLGREPVSDGEPWGVVGDDHVFVAEVDRGSGHVGQRRTSVGPVRMQVAVASEGLAHGCSDTGVGSGRDVELAEVGAGPARDGVGDHRAGGRPDAGKLGERSGGRSRDELIGVELGEHRSCVAERTDLLRRREPTVEEMDSTVHGGERGTAWVLDAARHAPRVGARK